jgi:hypothetical protein
VGSIDSVRRVARDARDRAEERTGAAAGSRPVRGLSRWGIGCRGAVYILVGYLAGRIAIGAAGAPQAASGQPADAQGAVQEVAGSPFGRITLALLAMGLAGYAISQLVEAIFRAREKDGSAGRWSQRLISGWGALLYGGFAWSTVSLLLGSRRPKTPRSSSTQDAALTARLLRLPLGRPLVVLIGVLLVGAGVEMGRRALRLNFRERFDEAELPRPVAAAAHVLGSFGCWARAAVFALLGGLLVRAALAFHPADAKGLDASLRTLAHAAYGPVLLGLVAAGLVAYGLYCWIEARYRLLPGP